MYCWNKNPTTPRGETMGQYVFGNYNTDKPSIVTKIYVPAGLLGLHKGECILRPNLGAGQGYPQPHLQWVYVVVVDLGTSLRVFLSHPSAQLTCFFSAAIVARVGNPRA